MNQLINHAKYYRRRCKYSLNFKKTFLLILLGYLILKTYIGVLSYESSLKRSKIRLKTVSKLNPESKSNWLNEDLKIDLEENDLETDKNFNNDLKANAIINDLEDLQETRDSQNDILPDDILPDAIVTDSEDDLKFENPDLGINRKYCGSNECKFLFAYVVMEQETRANLHFLTFTQIALELNRIIVLTNVGDSRIRTCKPFSFDFYYNIEFLRKKFPHLKFITQDDFQLWTKERFQKPNTAHTVISVGPSFTTEILEFSESYRDNYYEHYCLDRFDLKFNEETIFKNIIINKRAYLDDIRDFVIENSQTDTEVLLYGHNLRFSLFDQSSQMEYAPHLLNAAKEVSESLHPYIAIHWRMETGNNEMMPGSTDYPLIGEKGQSSTFRNITEFHYEAMRIIKTSPILFKNWTSINVVKYLKNVNALKKFGENFDHQLEKELMGPGIQGIFDKLILLNSDYFIGGPEGCCRASSSFTRSIENGRKILIRERSNKIKNIYAQW
ncbi:6850_t:CDS:2 [Diversispora eburnea]|uniref:6850_t:CDS:1 n=1 Tax=Diversispora eburnea TaxID=1213867 RepID=A0A9N8V9S9_9GLOM|nr:6850_t:CDS:2 [Diversispora eburnea]